MIKKVCILASLSQKSDIEEAVAYYKSQGYIVDYPTEQRDKTLFEIDYDYICRIAKAGMVVAIPKYEGGFGESVTYELAVAKYLGIPRAQYDPVKSAVRETMCTSCIHREVCLYKQTYLEYLRACEKMYEDYPDDISSFIEESDPNCIHYKKKSDVNLR